MKVGDRVIATYPNGAQSELSEIVDGPIFKGDKTIFKVRHSCFNNWVPAEWLRPHLEVVSGK